MTLRTRSIGVSLVCLAVLGGCGDFWNFSGNALESNNGILRFVPAETPYVFASMGKIPRGLAEKLETRFDTGLRAASGWLADRAMMGGTAPYPGKPAAFLAALEPFLSVEGLRAAGVRYDSQFAIYAVGQWPVARVTVTDASLADEALAAFDARLGGLLEHASAGGHSYRYLDRRGGRLILAVLGQDLIAASIPPDLAAGELLRVLGLIEPEETIGESGRLADLASRFGLSDVGLGAVDLELLADALDRSLTNAGGAQRTGVAFEVSQEPDICAAETRRIAAVLPGVVVGIPRLEEDSVVARAVFSLRTDIAESLARHILPVPGLGGRPDALAYAGMGIELRGFRELLEQYLEAYDESPLNCAELAMLRAGILQTRVAVAQPLQPLVRSFGGFLAVLDSMGEPLSGPDLLPAGLRMKLLLATENANGLMAMGVMFMPEIGRLQIEPDGSPVRLDVPQLAVLGQPVDIAMTENGLAISTGEGMAGDLGRMLRAKPADPQPVLTFGLDLRRYGELAGSAWPVFDNVPNNSGIAGDRGEGEAGSAPFGRFDLRVDFNAVGVQIESSVEFEE